MIHYYYLHTNGSLIHRMMPIDDESDFVKDTEKRETAWTLLLEALAKGANVERVNELAIKWQCTAKNLTRRRRRVNLLIWAVLSRAGTAPQ